MLKLLLRLVPFETLVESVIDRLTTKANEAMAREGAECIVKRVATCGAHLTAYAQEACKVLADAKIDAEETAQLKARFVPYCVELIKKAVA